MTRTFLKKFYPGSFVSESNHVEVPDRSKPEKVENGCYAYQFYERTEIVQDGETLAGKPKNYSPMYYVGGTIHNLESIQQITAFDTTILQRNMTGNNWEFVVETRLGQFMPFGDDDFIVECEEREDGIYLI